MSTPTTQYFDSEPTIDNTEVKEIRRKATMTQQLVERIVNATASDRVLVWDYHTPVTAKLIKELSGIPDISKIAATCAINTDDLVHLIIREFLMRYGVKYMQSIANRLISKIARQYKPAIGVSANIMKIIVGNWKTLYV